MNGLEIKIVINGNDFKLVTTMFINDRDFKTIRKRTDSLWYEVHKKNQRTVDDWSGGIGLFGGHLKPYQGYWYPIKWVCIYGRP